MEKKRKKRKKSKRFYDVARLLFFLYLGFMTWLLFVMGMENTNGIILEGGYSINIIPFRTVKTYIDMASSITDAYMLRRLFINLMGSIALFIPLGFFLPCIWKELRSFFKTAGIAVAIILGVEITQLITFVGSCDIDDFILNTLGTLIGYFIWLKFQKKFNI